jgi:hypothetical protein
LIFESRFQPTATIVTIFATDQGQVLSVQTLIPAILATETVAPTGTSPTGTPTTVPTPKPTRTPTIVVPPTLRTIYTQTGSRSGNQSKVTVCLDRAAPAGGLTVLLSANRPSLFPVPSSVLIPDGRECLSVNVLVGATSRTIVVTVTARLGSTTRSGDTTVRPARPALYMQTVSRAGGFSKVTVCARNQGETVLLTSSNPTLFPVPASVVIPAGSTCLSITVPVGMIDGSENVTVTATFSTDVVTRSTKVREMSG